MNMKREMRRRMFWFKWNAVPCIALAVLPVAAQSEDVVGHPPTGQDARTDQTEPSDSVFQPVELNRPSVALQQAQRPAGVEWLTRLASDEIWKMRLDFAFDGELREASNGGRWSLKARNGRIIGRFIFPGEEYRYTLTGEIADGAAAASALRQDGSDGYVCFYAGKTDADGRIFGSWFDNRGRSGDFEMVNEIPSRTMRLSLR